MTNPRLSGNHYLVIADVASLGRRSPSSILRQRVLRSLSVIQVDEIQLCESIATTKATERLFDQRRRSLGCSANLVVSMIMDTDVF